MLREIDYKQKEEIHVSDVREGGKSKLLGGYFACLTAFCVLLARAFKETDAKERK